MPSVVYLCEYGTIYGGENSMLSGLLPLQQMGFDVAVACPEQTPLAREVAGKGGRFLPFQWADNSGRRKPLEVLRSELQQAIALWDADLVHANSLSVSRILGPVARSQGTQFVGHVRDIVKLSRQATRDVSMLDWIFCVSEATRSFHLRQGMNAERSCVLHNGVDLARFAPPPRRPDTHPLKLVFLGQLVMRKGVDVLLAAVHQALCTGADLTLDLYGECHSVKDEARQYLNDLEHFVSEANLADRVRFRGRTDAPDEVLRAADVLVHPARQEPWGRVLLEAASCGLPIISTLVGGTPEMFPREEAILVPPDDIAALSAAIVALSESRALREELGEKARSRMHQFEVSDFADKLAAHYRKLLQQTAK